MASNLGEKASFVCDTSGKTVTVYVRGEIDHHTAVDVRNGIDAMLFEKRPNQLRLELSGVGFMDSSGLGLIMGRLSVMKALGGGLLLLNPSRETRRILSLAGIERIVPVAYTGDHGKEQGDVSASEVVFKDVRREERRRIVKKHPSA